ncbi:hypothetical protein MPER_09013 [Moniliophthora perniciosa FA553]|nr:hypothetical protein MPER_09013 [Moniliophthora perniciosa FA553]
MSGRLSDPATIVLCSITAILALSLAASILAKRTNLPPGPTKLPLIGNTLEVFRGKSMEELIAKWWKTYGPIVHVNIFGRNIVFINDLHMAQELTEKRGNIYMLGWNTVFTMPYGPQFRKHRRMMQTVLSEKAVDSFRHMQAKSAMLFVKLLVSDAAEDLQRHIKRYAAATMMKVAYDHDVDSLEDPIVKLSLEAATETLELGTVSTTIVDYIPALGHLPAWFPFAGLKRRAIGSS